MMNISAAAVERFAALFKGGDHARGVCEMPKVTKPGEKVKARQYTVAEATTVTHYAAHLAGQKGLGIIPIDRAGLCTFAAIDIDIIGIDLAALNRRCVKLGLPLIVCRSKSGGAHCYLFFTNPAEAERARALLAKWAAALGHPGVEIFPKQDQLDKKDVGNWINLPYYDADKTERYAVAGGKPVSLAGFLTLAEEARRGSLADVEGIELPPAEPEAVQVGKDGKKKKETASERIRKGESTEGQRHKDLLAYLVNQKKNGVDPDDLRVLAAHHAGNPNWTDELRAGSRKAQAMLAWIEKKVETDEEIYTALARIETDPVTWRLTVYGKTVLVKTDQLMSHRLLRNAVMEQITRILPVMKDSTWHARLETLGGDVRVETVAADLTPKGQAWLLVLAFLVGRAQARSKDELIQGKPWTDDEDKRVYFRTDALTRYLNLQRNFTNLRELALILREHKGKNTTLYIKGTTTAVWWLPEDEVRPARQTEDYAVPRLVEEI